MRPEFEELKTLNAMAYSTRARVYGYAYKPTVFSVVTAQGAAKIINQQIIGWTKEDARRMSKFHQEEAARKEALWYKKREEAHMRVFGVEPTFLDYKISGIGRDEYSEEDKNFLRACAHDGSRHKRLADAWAYLAKHYLRRVK